uniref:Outer membrane protein beta-barrel domain-containing protein n=1 Tax=Chlorobium phaeobacteroides (strain BS1) TaxID=331678 RepID=B3EM96_CHLPB
MTVCSVKTIVLFFMLLLFPATLFAQPGSFQKHWEIGTEIYHAVYEEPGIMQETGFMYGVKSAVAFHEKIVGPVDMIRIEGAYARGAQEYSSFWTGNIDAIDVSVFEIRGSLGHDVASDRTVWTPYLGLGYRWKKDSAYGLISTSGALGYDRESQYLYSPLGIAVEADLENGWFVGGFVEYDYFWGGTQKSAFSDLHPLNSDLVNDQEKGYGLRASLKIRKQLHESFLVAFEPFLRYWSIDQSQPGEYMEYNAFLGRAVQKTGYEPENTSFGYGVNISLLF